MFYIDWTYIVLVMPAVLFSLWASYRVQSTFAKYDKQYTACGMTGAEAARLVLDRNGLSHVKVERTPGSLTDHYSPQNNVVYLSDATYHSTSAAAIGVAAHEVGHAIQHAQNYVPIRIRSAIIPVTNIGARLSVPLILLGMLFSYFGPVFFTLAIAGVVCFGLCVLFQLVTLPVEFNASRRAVEAIEYHTSLHREEVSGAKKVLFAAALTYVAALAVSLMQLLRLVVLVSSASGRRRR